MPFVKETQRIMLGILLAFFVVGIAASYWAIVGADTILLRTDNPRLFIQERQIERGSIYDINDTVLAETTTTDEDTKERQYSIPATFGTTGYYSLRYGVGGIEAAYNSILRGDTLPYTLQRFFEIDLLHGDSIGSDIRLTLDADIQSAIVRAMAGRHGAIIVMRASDNAVVSLISQPNISPNTLDEDWSELAEDVRNPFFNRVTQGQYQPGGIMQNIVMVAAVLTGSDFDTVTADGDAPMIFDDTTIRCAISPPSADISLSIAYGYGCPRPFSLLAQANQQSLQPIVDAFALDTVPNGINFVVDAPVQNDDRITSTAPTTLEADDLTATSELDLLKNMLGQGSGTVNPLSVAMMTSSIVNDGVTQFPYMLDAVRAPGGKWEQNPGSEQSRAVMTDRSARRLRDLWIQHVIQIDAYAPLRFEGFITGAHVATANSGDMTIAWVNGFIDDAEGETYVVTVVLEDSLISEAIQLAGLALRQIILD